MFFFFQAEDGIRDLVRSRGLGDVYKRQATSCHLFKDALADPANVVLFDCVGSKSPGIWRAKSLVTSSPNSDRYRDYGNSECIRLYSLLWAVSYTHLTLPTIYSV
eukprot:TRINITY_DN2697_c0_g1_i1.p1 TRINITY_DN2697_c0_g1~~TRINITY_DN2697_c0_g1_i1.p1  ORF type:complete len:105 (+),score=42.16 TRINITY_DN2697_c0_g1_i1:60-374(+)